MSTGRDHEWRAERGADSRYRSLARRRRHAALIPERYGRRETVDNVLITERTAGEPIRIEGEPRAREVWS